MVLHENVPITLFLELTVQLGMIKLFLLDLFLCAVNMISPLCLINVQVDKLKVLSESLANSASKAEKRISDHRLLPILVL